MKLADLERHLRQHGCVLYREGGSHSIGRTLRETRLPAFLRHREIKQGTMRAICKPLEIPAA